MGFVESFEKTLVEGMMLPEGSNGGQVSSTLAGDLMYDPTASASLAPASPTPSGSRSKTPSPRHSPSLRKSPAPTFNWDAALDGSSGDISAEPLKAVQPDVAPRTIASQRISDARQNHARRQSMPPGSMTASKPPISKESDTTEETDGWGW